MQETNKDTALMFRYWGKAKPCDGSNITYHLLPFHCLDVAAVGCLLLRQQRFSIGVFSKVAGLSEAALASVTVFFLALHDIGKFARGFQNLFTDPGDQLVPEDPGFEYGGDIHHDTLGWVAWKTAAQPSLSELGSMNPTDGAWEVLLRTSCGHHGEPPREIIKGYFPVVSLKDRYFHGADLAAVSAFVKETAALLLPDGLPESSGRLRIAMKQRSWWFAGLAVLADWIGSNQDIFTYVAEPMPLKDYWETYALPRANIAINAAGITDTPVAKFRGAKQLFPYLSAPSPLQSLAETIPLSDEPQLFILEEATGAGKTEAALILAHRLMERGLGDGLYFGLPTMATSNQMYQRVGDVFRHFFVEGSRPNIVLAHGARNLVEEFQASILPISLVDQDYQDLASAGGACAAWMADSNKKALLAEVGVGTIDQALLSVMPARHQSLRLLGLCSKVLIVDEVHAYDAYTGELLQTLLDAHARNGGTAILLSATLPSDLRARLVAAYQRGLGINAKRLDTDSRFPLVTHVSSQSVATKQVATRESARKRVSVRFIHDKTLCIARIRDAAAAGQCVCWIRNTVDDARETFELLIDEDWIAPGHLTLFHSRFALLDRLRIENRVLDTFGKKSGQRERQGQVLIATQVVEQSLDLDFDVLISDLAPIDALIQRAGRLHRHFRDAHGDPTNQNLRSVPVFDVYGPEFDDQPRADWYSQMFRGASYVYPDTGRLWLTQRVLRDHRAIVLPENARVMIEAVYGPDTDAQIPAELQRASDSKTGKDTGHRTLARINALNLTKGYCRESGGWDEESRNPTRLSEDDRECVLLVADQDGLRAYADEHAHPWAASAVKIAARRLDCITPAWDRRFAFELKSLKERYRALRYAMLIPLVAESGALHGKALDKANKPVDVRYSRDFGLETTSPASDDRQRLSKR